MSDIRYSFLNVLDHFPCDLVRTLWLIQSLDTNIRNNEQSETEFIFNKQNLLQQSVLLNDLVELQITQLRQQNEELLMQQTVQKRYNNLMKKNPNLLRRLRRKERSNQIIQKKDKMKIKINLKQLREKELIQLRQNYSNDAIERYCRCQQPSYGDMVACDNDACSIEWFHYKCVGITQAPKGKWYCSSKCKKQSTAKTRPKKKRKRRN